MYNPRKVWLLYAKRLHELLRRNADQIPPLIRTNLDRVATDIGLELDPQHKDRLLEIALAFFQEEYLEAYRRAGSGEEPDDEMSATESCSIVERTTGYPVVDLYRRMVREIVRDQDRPEEAVVETLIRDFGAYPARAILEFDLRSAPVPENHLPDFCLALAVSRVVEQGIERDQETEEAMITGREIAGGSSDADRREIEQVINDSIGWALTKDKERLFAIMAQDEDFFIFHPDSGTTVSGFESFRRLAEKEWMTDAFRATDFAVRELRITFSRSGTVAWYSAFLDDHGEWNGKRVGWNNARWTGVVEKRDGGWVIAQMHFSFAKD
jgi:hypothetical protein